MWWQGLWRKPQKLAEEMLEKQDRALNEMRESQNILLDKVLERQDKLLEQLEGCLQTMRGKQDGIVRRMDNATAGDRASQTRNAASIVDADLARLCLSLKCEFQ